MQIHRQFLNRLDPDSPTREVVVVIDVLRSFSTAAYAFAAGARVIYPVETIAEGMLLQQRLPRSVTTGAVAGGGPVPGFNFGNSPSLLANRDLHGLDVIQTTAAGVRGLYRFPRARAVFACSLVCAYATASAILKLGADDVTLLITGEWIDRDGDEDIACADYLEALLHGESPAPGSFEQRVRESDFGRRFGKPEYAHLPISDLALCAKADRFNFAMRAFHDGQHLQLQRSFFAR